MPATERSRSRATREETSPRRLAGGGSRSADYRADIDVLRAIAVLAVIGFHWNVGRLSGGFIGVDIFFVISGYLISGQVISESRQGTFSIRRFYARRARRILPALYAMMAVVAIVMTIGFPSTVRLQFFSSLFSVVTFLSNIYFWQHTGYFETAGVEKVLLHTWSLSVEEQFYFAFPVLLLFIRPRTRAAGGYAALLLGILVTVLCGLTEVVTRHNPTVAFFLAPLRAYEFLIGTIVFLLRDHALRQTWARWIGTTVAAVLMIGPAFLYTQSTPFPGLSALVPCLGAALAISSGEQARPGRPPRLVAAGAFIGRISYSLYLWHWPLFLLLKDWDFVSERPDLAETAILSAATLALSLGSYWLVEQPARRASFNIRGFGVVSGIASAGLVLGAAAFAFMIARGFPGRDIALLTKYQRENVTPFYAIGTCFLDETTPFDRFARQECMTPVPTKRNVVLWGDSVAAHYIHGLRAMLDPARYNLMQITAAACGPFPKTHQPGAEGCDQLNDAAPALISADRPDLVILSGNWRGYQSATGDELPADDYRRVAGGAKTQFEWLLLSTLSTLQKANIPVVLFGPSMEFSKPLPQIIERRLSDGDIAVDDVDLRPDLPKLDSEMETLAGRFPNVRFVSIIKQVCPNNHCRGRNAARIPLVWDRIHLTPEGSEAVVGAIRPTLETIIDTLLLGNDQEKAR